jgi:hypothetical protein
MPGKSIFIRRLSVEVLEHRRVLASLPFGAAAQDTGEFMLGSVAVTPVLFESNGQLDPSTEDWTSAHIEQVLNNIRTGVDWWVETLAKQSTVHELSFTIDTTYASTPVDTKYEPISRRSNDYYLYVSEFLTGAGFGSGSLESNIRAFNHAQREKLGTDWAFTIFVVPSVNDADGQFAAGGSFNRAFAFAGGLFMVVPSTRPASTYTHETGHMFWARDEYAGGGSYYDQRGYYNTQNTNAANNPEAGFVQQPSIMASGALLDLAFASNFSPASTLAQIGWQDSNGNGIFDVLDVPHSLSGTGYLDVDSNTYRFTGSAAVQTLANLNSSGLRNDITLNRIREIEYRFDGGEWQVALRPEAYSVEIELNLNVPANAMEIEIRARDSKTTVESNIFRGRLSRADSTLAPGINGVVWIDTNLNGLRDAGELGRENWLVELVDGNHQLLPLRKTIEPDNLPEGVLANDFSPHVILTAVGSDTDGRIGVFTDVVTSTGSKNFRVFSRGSQTFVSGFNNSSRQFQATFSQPTGMVMIDVIGSTNNSRGRLEAFNAAGELVGRTTSEALASGQFETLTITRGAADIAYIRVGGHGNSNIKLDNLRLGPEASTTTGKQGQFSFPYLSPGEYNVRVTHNGGFTALSNSGNLQSVTVAANTASQDLDFGFQIVASNWQNPRNPYDVNDDQIVSALDVLLIVNEINANGSRDLRGTGTPFRPYVDVTGENIVSALDVLQVVNFINANPIGEGETQSTLEAFRPAAVESVSHISSSEPQHVFDSEKSLTEATQIQFFAPAVGKLYESLFEDEKFLRSLELELAASALKKS